MRPSTKVVATGLFLVVEAPQDMVRLLAIETNSWWSAATAKVSTDGKSTASSLLASILPRASPSEICPQQWQAPTKPVRRIAARQPLLLWQPDEAEVDGGHVTSSWSTTAYNILHTLNI